MADPLHRLAFQDKLPLHQYLDEDTLDWIEENNPFKVRNLNNSTKEERAKLATALLKSLEVVLEWYTSILLEFQRANSSHTLHGDLHALRVSFFSILLSIDNVEVKPAQPVLAGLFHDIARLNDQTDEGHGVRSALVTENYLAKINTQLSTSEINQIITAIKRHDELSNEGLDELSAVLKVADALDRYRLPKTKWWPNEAKMPFAPSSDIFYIAYKLVLNSEARVLQGERFTDAMKNSVIAITREFV